MNVPITFPIASRDYKFRNSMVRLGRRTQIRTFVSVVLLGSNLGCRGFIKKLALSINQGPLPLTRSRSYAYVNSRIKKSFAKG
jgi:hypothetical protein